MSNLTLINNNGEFAIDSREVAELTQVRHSDLLEKIAGYTEHLTNGKFRSLNFFIPHTYEDSKGETRPCYLLTRKGCDMVANKMTGEKGVLFTAAYVTKFEEMKETINNPYLGLSKELQAIIMQDKKIQVVESRVEKLENTMTIDYTQQEELRQLVNKVVIDSLGGKSSQAYRLLSNKAFAEIWGYYKREMGVNSYKNTATKDFEKAKEVILAWNPDEGLGLMIIGANVKK